MVKETATALSPSIVIEQFAVELVHAPDQPEKVEMAFGAARRLAVKPVLITPGEQALPERHDRSPLTEPPPVPVKVRAKVRWRIAEQVAIEPPFVPLQVQFQEPLPDTDEAAPVEQRLLEGGAATRKAPPFALPQTPFIGATGITLFDDWEATLVPFELVAVTMKL
jgi:hypothetical protein